MPFIIILVVLAGWYVINVLATWVVQWGLTEITHEPMPFWPIFWILVVLTALFGGSSKAAS